MRTFCTILYLSSLCALCYADGQKVLPVIRDITPVRTVEDHIRLGIERLGTRLDVIWTDKVVYPRPTDIRAMSPDCVFLLTDLNQMRGLIFISSASQALRFVRLRTARAFADDEKFEHTFEIVSIDQRGKSAYLDTGIGLGSKDIAEYGANEPFFKDELYSGEYGLVSPVAYTQAHFGPPVIKQTVYGYQITRWVVHYGKRTNKDAGINNHIAINGDTKAHLALDDGTKAIAVQKWQEFVGRDGSYRQTVITSISPPTLPDTYWVLPLEEFM